MFSIAKNIVCLSYWWVTIAIRVGVFSVTLVVGNPYEKRKQPMCAAHA